jgi:hypothetical protein
MMTYKVTIQITEEHVRYAARKYFFKRFGTSTVLLSLGAVLLMASLLFDSRKVDWSAGVLIGMLGTGMAAYIALYFGIPKKKVERLKQYGGTIIYEFSDDLFKVMYSLGSADIKWETFKEIWLFPKAWLLLPREGGGYYTFPTDQISGDISDFLKRRIMTAGGQIK